MMQPYFVLDRRAENAWRARMRSASHGHPPGDEQLMNAAAAEGGAATAARQAVVYS
jgi:hypothetical protein